MRKEFRKEITNLYSLGIHDYFVSSYFVTPNCRQTRNDELLSNSSCQNVKEWISSLLKTTGSRTISKMLIQNYLIQLKTISTQPSKISQFAL